MFRGLVVTNPVRKSNGHFPSLLSDQFFSDFFESDYGLASTSKQTWPAVDIHEYKDKYVLHADIPGVDENDVKIEISDGNLILQGSRSKEAEKTEEGSVLVSERVSSSFKRVFAIGELVQADKVEATYHNGTLTIDIPKSERAVPRQIPIAVKKGS